MVLQVDEWTRRGTMPTLFRGTRERARTVSTLNARIGRFERADLRGLLRSVVAVSLRHHRTDVVLKQPWLVSVA
jgi:hypothetical protein